MGFEFTNERRMLDDRRNFDNTPLFPFFDKEQTLVRKNRRRTPNRRINNIEIDSSYKSFKKDTRLFLWYKDGICELSPNTNEVIVGRAQSCELIFQNLYISRHHASFKFENGKFAITDHSTNGTYIKKNENEMFLMNEKMVLNGSGIVSLGTPIEYAENEVIHYFCP